MIKPSHFTLIILCMNYLRTNDLCDKENTIELISTIEGIADISHIP